MKALVANIPQLLACVALLWIGWELHQLNQGTLAVAADIITGEVNVDLETPVEMRINR